MTAVTALLALGLSACSSDTERVEENTTVTLDELGISFVVPTGFRDADEALVRAQAAAQLRRSGGPSLTKGPKQGTKKQNASVAATVAELTAAQVQQLVDRFAVFLVDPATEGDKHPSMVLALAQEVPLTTGTGTTLQAGLEAAKGIDSVELMTQTTKAGQAVRATYALTIGKDADGDDVELYFQTIELGIDDTSSVQITASSLDEDVARDLADTVVASVTTA